MPAKRRGKRRASWLLTKRADLINEVTAARDRIAEIKNDVDALDRVLASLGYTGDLDEAMPRQKVWLGRTDKGDI